jgi:hypothetical protein
MNEEAAKKSAPFALSATKRLKSFLAERTGKGSVAAASLTPDASTREYFRIPWENGAAIVAAYPEPRDPALQNFLDVTGLLKEAGLPVPEIYEVDELRGLIVQEDFGDLQLYSHLQQAPEEERERLREEAIALIARIQMATGLAYQRDSVASRLAFDFEKLYWELKFFFEHFFGSLRGEKLPARTAEKLLEELSEVALELAERPRVLCHRDYHAGNLQVGEFGQLCLIDYQDARMGPASYDLVSLLLDRVTKPPSLAETRMGRLLLLEERKNRGLEVFAAEDFAAEFRLMAVQRVLKAIGTFSYQTGVRKRGATYAKFIQPMLQVAVQAAEFLERFPVMRALLKERAAAPYT